MFCRERVGAARTSMDPLTWSLGGNYCMFTRVCKCDRRASQMGQFGAVLLRRKVILLSLPSHRDVHVNSCAGKGLAHAWAFGSASHVWAPHYLKVARDAKAPQGQPRPATLRSYPRGL